MKKRFADVHAAPAFQRLLPRQTARLGRKQRVYVAAAEPASRVNPSCSRPFPPHPCLSPGMAFMQRDATKCNEMQRNATFLAFCGMLHPSTALGTGCLKSRARRQRSACATAASAHSEEAVGTHSARQEKIECITCFKFRITFRILSPSHSLRVTPHVVYRRRLIHKSCIKMHRFASLFRFFRSSLTD